MSSDCGKAYGTRDYVVEDFSSPPTRVVWSPLFENSPGRNYSMKARISGLKDHNPSSDGELPPGWRTAEEQQRNLLLRKYLSPKGKQTGKGLLTSSDEDCSRSWKAAKLSYSSLEFGTIGVERCSHLKEHLSTSNDCESRASRRYSAGNYTVRHGNGSGVSSRKSDSDISAHGKEKFLFSNSEKEETRLRLAPELRGPPRDTSSSLGGSDRGKNVLPTPLEDWSESELKRTRMETTGSETCSKQRRSKIRILEKSEGLNCRQKDDNACGVGSGGIGRGRVVKGNDNAGNARNIFPDLAETQYEVRQRNINNDQLDFNQKCRNWSVADGYFNEDGKAALWRPRRHDDGSDQDTNWAVETEASKPRHDTSFQSALDSSFSPNGRRFSDPMFSSPNHRALQLVANRDSLTGQSSSEPGSIADSPSLNSKDILSARYRSAGQKLSLMKEAEITGRASNGQPDGMSRRKSSSDERYNVSQGSDPGRSGYKNSLIESSIKARKEKYDSATSKDHSTVTTDREKELTAGSLKELRRKKRILRKRRSQSPTAAVACAASMIGDTVEAVRKVREDAAELAFKLAELHAHDAKSLRSAAAVVRHHVDSLHTEVQSFQVNWARREAVEFPWHAFLREFMVAASLVSGVFSIQSCINSVRNALGSLKQTSSRKQKIVLAAVLLTVGARFGNGVYQGLGQVKSVKRARDKQLREHLKVILERTSLLSNLAHTDPTSATLETPTPTDVEDDRQSILNCR